MRESRTPVRLRACQNMPPRYRPLVSLPAGDAQLSVVRRVEPQKILIDIGNISYLPFFNSDAVSNVIFPRRVVSLYRYGAGLAFDDADMDDAALNGLRG